MTTERRLEYYYLLRMLMISSSAARNHATVIKLPYVSGVARAWEQSRQLPSPPRTRQRQNYRWISSSYCWTWLLCFTQTVLCNSKSD